MSTGAFRSTGATLNEGSGADDVLLRITTDGPHVCVVRTGRLAPPRPRPKTRNLCGRKIAEVDGPGICARCRASVGKLALNIIRREGADARISVDGRTWPIWVLRVVTPPFLGTLAQIDAPASGAPPITWARMCSANSTVTHVAPTRLRVSDGSQWFQATDDALQQTICLRQGWSEPSMSGHPDDICKACASARDRLLLQAMPHQEWAAVAPTTSAAVVADGDPVPPLLADPSRLTIVASMRPIDGGHARLDWMLRPDATMSSAHRVAKATGITPGRVTLCGAEPSDPPAARTPSGGCRRCAASAGRIGLVVTRQWPGVRSAILVNEQVVPADVLGGDRIRLADPALQAHARPLSVTTRPPDRIERCSAAAGATSYARQRVHLGWQQRLEVTAWGQWWAAVLPHPAATLCGQPARPAGHSAVGTNPPLACEACAAKALRPLSSMGRHAPAKNSPLEIIGSTYDDAVVELMGEAFAIAMLCDDMTAHVVDRTAADEGTSTASDR